jgi:hypothetical protein
VKGLDVLVQLSERFGASPGRHWTQRSDFGQGERDHRIQCARLLLQFTARGYAVQRDQARAQSSAHSLKTGFCPCVTFNVPL